MGKKIFGALVALSFFYVSSPLILPIAMGAVLAVLFFPWLERLEKKNIPTGVGSVLLTLGITLVIILPTSLLIFFAAKTAFHQLSFLGQTPNDGQGLLSTVLGTPRIHSLMVWVTDRVPMNMLELGNAFQELAGRMGARLTELIGGVLAQLPGIFVALSIVVVSVYFFLVDGRKVIFFLRRNSLFTPQQTEQLMAALAETCRSVILASVVSGGLQAGLEILGCVLTGTPNAALVGLLVFIASFLPVVGSAPITLTVAVHQLLAGRQVAGTILLVIAMIIFTLDNMIRPLILKGSANLHPLLAFVAAFGGLQTLGFLGVFLGPIVAALFVVTIQILARNGESASDRR